MTTGSLGDLRKASEATQKQPEAKKQTKQPEAKKEPAPKADGKSGVPIPQVSLGHNASYQGLLGPLGVE